MRETTAILDFGPDRLGHMCVISPKTEQRLLVSCGANTAAASAYSANASNSSSTVGNGLTDSLDSSVAKSRTAKAYATYSASKDPYDTTPTHSPAAPYRMPSNNFPAQNDQNAQNTNANASNSNVGSSVLRSSVGVDVEERDRDRDNVDFLSSSSTTVKEQREEEVEEEGEVEGALENNMKKVNENENKMVSKSNSISNGSVTDKVPAARRDVRRIFTILGLFFIGGSLAMLYLHVTNQLDILTFSAGGAGVVQSTQAGNPVIVKKRIGRGMQSSFVPDPQEVMVFSAALGVIGLLFAVIPWLVMGPPIGQEKIEWSKLRTTMQKLQKMAEKEEISPPVTPLRTPPRSNQATKGGHFYKMPMSYPASDISALGSNLLKAKRGVLPVPIELCPTSNSLTLHLPSLSDHPTLETLLEAQYPVAVSTDDSGVFNVTLSGELHRTAIAFDLSESQVAVLARQAFTFGFCRYV